MHKLVHVEFSIHISFKKQLEMALIIYELYASNLICVSQV